MYIVYAYLLPAKNQPWTLRLGLGWYESPKNIQYPGGMKILKKDLSTSTKLCTIHCF